MKKILETFFFLNIFPTGKLIVWSSLFTLVRPLFLLLNYCILIKNWINIYNNNK